MVTPGTPLDTNTLLESSLRSRHIRKVFTTSVIVAMLSGGTLVIRTPQARVLADTAAPSASILVEPGMARGAQSIVEVVVMTSHCHVSEWQGR